MHPTNDSFQQPGVRFDPMQITSAPSLTVARQRQILDQWEQALRKAPLGKKGTLARLLRQLSQIRAARAALE